MNFVSVRDFRAKSRALWKKLKKCGELVITSNGKPIAIVTPTTEQTLEDTLAAVRRAHAVLAISQMQQTSVRTGTDKLTLEEIATEIQATRKKRLR